MQKLLLCVSLLQLSTLQVSTSDPQSSSDLASRGEAGARFGLTGFRILGEEIGVPGLDRLLDCSGGRDSASDFSANSLCTTRFLGGLA